MKRTLLLTSALAVLAVCVASGVSVAQLTIGGGGINIGGLEINLLADCRNGADDDGDGLVDMGDPGCAAPSDASEDNPPPPPPPPPPPTTTNPDPGTTGGGGGGGGFSGGGNDGGGTREGGGGGITGGGGGAGEAGELIGGETGSGTGRDVRIGNPGAQPRQGKGPIKPPPDRQDDGVPTLSNPTTTIAPFGPAPVGVPNIVIDQFEIPPFLLPIYQACGTQYAIPWQVLASINKIETAFGTNLNVSTAGAVGWMQFLPSTWEAYGVDANADGRKDPYNPVDAICAASRYLRAAGGEQDLRTAIFAYNHADWYVDEVLLYAEAYGKLPDSLVGSLTGLSEDAHFPVAANARYADDISEREAIERAKPSRRAELGNAADVISASPTRRGINIYSREGAPVVAVKDGVIKKIGESPKLGNYLVLQDAYGNRYIYAQLGRVVKVHPVPKPRKLTARDFRLVSPPEDATPTKPATDGGAAATDEGTSRTVANGDGPMNTEDLRARLYANPERPANRDRASLSGQLDDLLGAKLPGYETFKRYFNSVFSFDPKSTELRPLRAGSKVVGGTVIARMGGPVGGVAPHINFAIRPAGRGAPKIDPKPILDGWKLLEATAIYRAAGKNPFVNDASVGQVLLMSKEILMQRVLADPRLEIYSCGRTDIASGQVDRRVLATLEFLAEKGFRMTITSLKCGHGFFTASGNVSNHSSGNAVDIAAINGIPVLGNQGPGTLTGALVRTAMQLQGSMVPEELISLEELGGPSFALADHADHVHIGWQPVYGTGKLDEQFAALLKPDQWERLIRRIGEIDNPTVPVKASKFSIPTGKGKQAKRASAAHVGDLAALSPGAELLSFVQLEYAGRLGLANGRYLAHSDGEERQVLVVDTLGGPRPRRRRPRRADPEPEPAELPLTRVTIVEAKPLGGEAEAARWLEQTSRDAEARDEAVEDAMWLLNQALHAQRASAADPYAPEVSAAQALVVRLGYGSGTQVVEGRFSEARELPLGKGPRWRPKAEDLRPQERLAAVLGGRERIDACETLLLRARADVEGERFREAALQLRIALDALLVELRGGLSDPGHVQDMGVLEARRGEVDSAAARAITGEPSPEQETALEEVLEVAERVVRRRRVLRG